MKVCVGGCESVRVHVFRIVCLCLFFCVPVFVLAYVSICVSVCVCALFECTCKNGE